MMFGTRLTELWEKWHTAHFAPEYRQMDFNDYQWKETKIYACYLGNEHQRYVDDSIFVDGIVRSGFVQVPIFWKLTYLLDDNGEHTYMREDFTEYFNLSAITTIKLIGLRSFKDKID